MGAVEQGILRLLVDGALEGVVNMAIDEAILEGINKGDGPATLRFYQWREPTISLGYFQKFEELARQDDEIGQMAVVRRQTGGGAILHDDELTYSLIMPLDVGDSSDIQEMYKLVHDAYIRVLGENGVAAVYRGGDQRGNSQRGPFFCFAREHQLDLTVGDDKLVGSAQRRIKNAVLQHGSLILQRHFAQQPCGEALVAGQKPIDLQVFMRQVADIISVKLGMEVVEGQLSDSERERSIELESKYAGEQWTEQR